MKKAILSTLAALTLATTLVVPAFAFADGSVHFDHRSGGDPSTSNIMMDLNPQPLPPGRHPLMISGYSDGTDGISGCAAGCGDGGASTVDTAHKSPGRNE